MSKITSLTPQKMWICVFEDKYYHYDTLDYTMKESIDKCQQSAQKRMRADYTWKELKEWGFKCVKVTVNIELT